MPAPGWNVTEPIALAYRLYRIAQQLHSAPEAAKDFKSKIEDFGSSLQELQEVLNDLGKAGHPTLSANSLDQLSKEVVESQSCIERCEEFISKFTSLTEEDGSTRAGGTGSAKWVWKKDRAAKLTAQIEGHITHIGFKLQIKSLYAAQ